MIRNPHSEPRNFPKRKPFRPWISHRPSGGNRPHFFVRKISPKAVTQKKSMHFIFQVIPITVVWSLSNFFLNTK